MIRLSIALILSSLISSSLAAQAPANAERELRAVDSQFVSAVIKNDKATLRTLLADDYYCVHSNGIPMTREQELASTAAVAWTESKTDDIKVRAYGDVGIVTGRLTLSGSAAGFASGVRRFTDFYLKRGGRWQSLGCAVTLVPEKK